MNRGNVVVPAVVSLLVIAALLVPVAGWAEYPERPINIIIGMDPGGPADLVARAASVAVERYLGKALVLENKGGGGGAIALSLIANAKPDGYTLCVTQNMAIVDTALMQKAPFKPLKSFTPVVAYHIGEHAALIVKTDSPFKTFNDFRDYARKNPGKIKYSTPGVGSGTHIAMEVVAHKDGLKVVHVPHKGSAPAFTAVLGGHVDVCSGGTAWPNYAKSGQVRPLAMYGRERLAGFGDVPTLKEMGYDFIHDVIGCVVGPAGLPAEVVNRVETAFKRAMEGPEYKTALAATFQGAFYLNHTEFEQHLKEKWSRTEKQLKQAGVIKEPATEPY